MARIALALVLMVWAVAPLAVAETVDDGVSFRAEVWPWWRGPARNGHAASAQDPPIEWNETKNVLWKSPIPGRGHGSPIVMGNRVLLPTADEGDGSQSVLAFDRATGKQLWHSVVHGSGLMKKNGKSSGASSTVATDGERVYINFANSDAVFVSALDMEGNKLWQHRLCDYRIHQGYGASPTIYQELVIAAADSHAGGAVAGLNRKTGELVWKHDRPKVPNYTSPILMKIGGKDQIVFTGCNLITSLDPNSGKLLWETKGATTECVTSTVTDGTRVFSSGGYPKNHLAAVMADGSGEIAWESKERVYVPSLLVKDGYLFGVLDAGIAACWKSATGEAKWKKRLRGEFSSSPILVGDKIYVTSESGDTFIYRANAEAFESIATNKLGDEVMATPTICGGKIYMRVAHSPEGKRQEMLYCLGKN